MSALANPHPNRLNNKNESKVQKNLVTSLEKYLSWTWYNPFSWFPVQRKNHGYLAKKLLTDLNNGIKLEDLFSENSFKTDSDKDLIKKNINNQDDFVTALDPILIKVHHKDLTKSITIRELFSSLMKNIKECLKPAPAPAPTKSITEHTLNTVNDNPECTTGVVTSVLAGTTTVAAGYGLLPVVAVAAAAGVAGYSAARLYNYFMTPTTTETTSQTGETAIVVGTQGAAPHIDPANTFEG